jgi:hypothetical protein
MKLFYKVLQLMVTQFIDNIWTMAIVRADAAGKELARVSLLHVKLCWYLNSVVLAGIASKKANWRSARDYSCWLFSRRSRSFFLFERTCYTEVW